MLTLLLGKRVWHKRYNDWLETITTTYYGFVSNHRPTWNTSVHTTALSPPCDNSDDKQVSNTQTILRTSSRNDLGDVSAEFSSLSHVPLCSKRYRPRLWKWRPPTDPCQLLQTEGGFRTKSTQGNPSSFKWPCAGMFNQADRGIRTWHTLVQSKSWGINDYSSVEDLWEKGYGHKLPSVVKAPLVPCWLLITHRLNNEEHGSQQTGCSAETQLQILGR